jgi:hypothetical protein
VVTFRVSRSTDGSVPIALYKAVAFRYRLDSYFGINVFFTRRISGAADEEWKSHGLAATTNMLASDLVRYDRPFTS